MVQLHAQKQQRWPANRQSDQEGGNTVGEERDIHLEMFFPSNQLFLSVLTYDFQQLSQPSTVHCFTKQSSSAIDTIWKLKVQTVSFCFYGQLSSIFLCRFVTSLCCFFCISTLFLLKNLFYAENRRIAVEFFSWNVAKICQCEVELCAKSLCACIYIYMYTSIF